MEQKEGKKDRKKIRIITTSGFKYTGEKISESSNFIKVKDRKEGIIQIPLGNISFLKELNSKEGENGRE